MRLPRTAAERGKILLIAIGSVVLIAALSWIFIGIWNRAIGNVPIRMYGRLVTPEGHGLAGVLIKARVTQMPFNSVPHMPWQRRTSKIITTTTDAQGDFAFISKGVGIDLLLEKVDTPGWAFWNQGGGMESGFLYYQETTRMPLPDRPEKRYVYLMVPAESLEAKYVDKRSREYESTIQKLPR